MGSRPVLIADSAEQLTEARLRLARVGVEDVRGFLPNGVAGWTRAGLALSELPQITVQDLGERLHDQSVRVLDVRRESEWQAGHIASADWWPLDRFRSELPLIDEKTVAVHCKSGYRSMIACSLLQRAGHPNVINVVGGFDAWQQAQLPFVTGAPVEA